MAAYTARAPLIVIGATWMVTRAKTQVKMSQAARARWHTASLALGTSVGSRVWDGVSCSYSHSPYSHLSLTNISNTVMFHESNLIPLPSENIKAIEFHWNFEAILSRPIKQWWARWVWRPSVFTIRGVNFCWRSSFQRTTSQWLECYKSCKCN